MHVELTGLEPDRWYWYRFTVGDAQSPIGRTRTMPRRDGMPEQLRFAFASCQNYEQGLFTAYEHMAADELDLVVHLGDYIYEMAGQDKRVRKHAGPEITTLDDYRNRYAQYRSDPHLQAAHARFPWLVVWDDHEFDNNCAGCISEELKVSPEEFLLRRANAYQAYYEHMPLRRTSLAARPGHAALPASHLRPAGRVRDARHAPVPHRSAQRRRQETADRRRRSIPAPRCWATGRNAG